MICIVEVESLPLFLLKYDVKIVRHPSFWSKGKDTPFRLSAELRPEGRVYICHFPA